MKIHFKISLLLVACAVTIPAFAQEKTSEKKEPQTKIEAFDAQTGSVIIKGFSTVGSVKGKFGSTVTVDAKEFTDASSGKKQYGIVIVVKEVSRLERSTRAYVDADEIDTLAKGIEYISKIQKSTTKLDNFQADYRTRGDLEVTTFSDSAGKIEAAVSCGRIGNATAYLTLQTLNDFKELVTKAKDKLDAIK